MKSFVIHMTKAVERRPLVRRIQRITGAKHFEAIVGTRIQGVHAKAGEIGCRDSHLAVYRLAPENEDILVFEDDCEILDPFFMHFIQTQKHKYDLMYIGINGRYVNNLGKPCSVGCHAMWISSKARKLMLQHKTSIIPIDIIWNEVEHTYGLRVFRPEHKFQFVRQKPQLMSYITGSKHDHFIEFIGPGVSRSVVGNILASARDRPLPSLRRFL